MGYGAVLAFWPGSSWIINFHPLCDSDRYTCINNMSSVQYIDSLNEYHGEKKLLDKAVGEMYKSNILQEIVS